MSDGKIRREYARAKETARRGWERAEKAAQNQSSTQGRERQANEMTSSESERRKGSIARIRAGHEAGQAAQDQRRKERQQLAYEEPETTEQQLDRLLQKMHDDPAWYDAQPPTLKIAIGHHYRNKLRIEALLGKPNEDATGDQQ